jgi:predicted DNA-binding protein YlxM (UPF0122 family)|tara:strand:- start:5876 stop:6232 length:357 start_codon:yes stop_codon:yes gene_type:complete
MEYQLKCRYCRKISEVSLTGFDSKQEQDYQIPCEHCGKTNEKKFPKELYLEKFYNTLNDEAKLYFQSYFWERKSLIETAKEFNTYKSRVEWVLKKHGLGLRTLREGLRNYNKKKRMKK